MVGGSGQKKKLDANVYGCEIAVGEPDPYTRVSYPTEIFGYANGAAGITNPASGTGELCMGDWDGCNLISGIKRQVNDGTGWVDTDKRSAVGGTTGTDVMTYVPTWWFRMENDGTKITLAFSDTKIDGEWQDYAGSVGLDRKGYFRIGCYGGYLSGGKLYSRGNTKPTIGTRIAYFIDYAKARGTGYDIMTWYQWTYLAALAVLLYKSTDLQAAMASGYVSGSEVQSETALTFYNDYGMAGSTSTTQQMAFFWIQNLWGNIGQFVGGAKTDSSYRLMTCTGYSSTADSDFDKPSLSPSLNDYVYGDISKVVGTTDAGFFPTDCSGSYTTYFADRGYVDSSSFPSVGGHSSSGEYAGPFNAFFNRSASETTSYIGSRLSYRL